MAQAYIFADSRKNALDFAKRLNCAAGGDIACGDCASCRVFESGNHPDTIFVKGTKQTGIGVDDVRRQIIMPAAQKPFKHRYKVFITEESLLPAAQNALLKTIEEPPPYGIFLFLAQSTHDFLPTVISRCAVMKSGDASRLRGNVSLESHVPGSQSELGSCAYAENSPEDASRLRGNVPPESHIPGVQSGLGALAEEIFGAVQGADVAQAFALYRKIEPLEKSELPEFLKHLYILCGKARRFDAADAVAHTKKILSRNANAQLAIELMLLKMR